jgi:hypothetical protein
MFKTQEPHWSDDHSNIVLTASYLVYSEGFSAENLFHFIEKPWHYDAEYEAAQAEYEASKDDGNRANDAERSLAS